MALPQMMSSAFDSDLWQSLGLELSLFCLTAGVAAALRVGPLFKAIDAPLKPRGPHGKAANFQKYEARQPAPTSDVPKEAQPQVPAVVPGIKQKVNSLISYADRRQADEALAIYEKLKVNGDHVAIKESAHIAKRQPWAVFSSLVQCAVRAARPELVAQFVEDMVREGIDRPVDFYETIMKVLASKKYYKEALNVCKQLEIDGLEPSAVTLSCLVNFAVELGEADRAIGFFNRLATTSVPPIRAYMTILRLYSGRQDWWRSLALIREMQQREAPIDSLVLNIVLATGVAASQLEAALELLREFAASRIADAASFNTILKGLAQKKDVDSAIKLLDEMSQAAVKPNAITYNTVMDAAVRGSQVSEAWKVLARMRDAGVAPDKFTCTTLMKRSLQSEATAEQLLMILDLLRNVTPECDSDLCANLFRNVIDMARKINDDALTRRVVSLMRENRVKLPPQECQRFLKLFLKDQEPVRSAAHLEPIRSAAPWRQRAQCVLACA